MTKALYVGIDNLARKVKKMYIGVDGIARKVQKAYVGVDSTARLFFSAELKLNYYGTATDLLEAQGGDNVVAATTVGNYALFGGGLSEPNAVAYDTSLTRTIPNGLSIGRSYLVATTVGNYALFGGGIYEYYDDDEWLSDYPSNVDAYDTSLTRTNPTELSVGRASLAATTVGNYALFCGGYNEWSSWLPLDAVDAYDASLTRTNPTGLSVGRDGLAATTVGDYALFGGGWGGNATTLATVDVYDISLTRVNPTELSICRASLAATTVGNYALFCGGSSHDLNGDRKNDYHVNTDAYDASLTRTNPTGLSVAREGLAATTVGDYAIFGGGYNYFDNNKNFCTVDVYTVG